MPQLFLATLVQASKGELKGGVSCVEPFLMYFAAYLVFNKLLKSFRWFLQDSPIRTQQRNRFLKSFVQNYYVPKIEKVDL